MGFLLSLFFGFSGPVHFCVNEGPCVTGRFLANQQLVSFRVEPAILSPRDKDLLVAFAQELEAKDLAPGESQKVDPRVKLLAQVAADFLPVGEVISPNDFDFLESVGESADGVGTGPFWSFAEGGKSGWTLICDKRGQIHSGEYTARGSTVRASAEVAVPSSRCRGRCGSGCGWRADHLAQTYTQECFEHDLCHTREGTQLGHCTDELRRAVNSYLFAPRCQ